jgi:hypothetical protein
LATSKTFKSFMLASLWIRWIDSIPLAENLSRRCQSASLKLV